MRTLLEQGSMAPKEAMRFSFPHAIVILGLVLNVSAPG